MKVGDILRYSNKHNDNLFNSDYCGKRVEILSLDGKVKLLDATRERPAGHIYTTALFNRKGVFTNEHLTQSELLFGEEI